MDCSKKVEEIPKESNNNSTVVSQLSIKIHKPDSKNDSEIEEEEEEIKHPLIEKHQSSKFNSSCLIYHCIVIACVFVIFMILSTALILLFFYYNNHSPLHDGNIKPTGTYEGHYNEMQNDLSNTSLRRSMKYECHVNKDNLKDFEENLDAYIKNYDLIIFDEDVETLSLMTTIEIDSDIEMRSASDTKIKIKCPVSKNKLFDIMNNASVKLSGFVVSDCHSINVSLISISENSNVTLENMHFSKSDYETHLLYVMDSILYMNFVEIEHNQFYNDYGIYISNSYFEIKNTLLQNNEAYGEKGKLIMIEDKSIFKAYSTKFNSNTNDAGKGGVIYADNSHITLIDIEATGNKAKTLSGGFAYITKSNVYISLLFCKNNEAKKDPDNGSGGCMHLYSCDSTMTNSTITENTGSNDAGGILVQKGSLNIKSSEFSYNEATHGGSLYLNNVIFEIKDTEISFNKAIDGGGLTIIDSQNGKITNTTFIYNEANGGSGGAIAMNLNNNIKFDLCKFVSNKATWYAGVIRLLDEKEAVIMNSSFIKNKARYGNIGYIVGSSNQEVILLNCTISENVSEDVSRVYEKY